MIGRSRSRWFSQVYSPLLAATLVLSCASEPTGHWVEADEALAGVHSVDVTVLPGDDLGNGDVYSSWPETGISVESSARFDEIKDLIQKRASAALRVAGLRVLETESDFEEINWSHPEDTLDHARITFEFAYGDALRGPSYSLHATATQTVMLGRNPSKYANAEVGLWFSTLSGSAVDGSRSLGPHPRFETVVAWLQRDVDSILEQLVTSAVSGAEGARGSESRQRTGKWDWLMDVADKGIIGFMVGGLVALGMLAKAYVKRKLLKRKGG